LKGLADVVIPSFETWFRKQRDGAIGELAVSLATDPRVPKPWTVRALVTFVERHRPNDLFILVMAHALHFRLFRFESRSALGQEHGSPSKG
jgi:hypothetical protein